MGKGNLWEWMWFSLAIAKPLGTTCTIMPCAPNASSPDLEFTLNNNQAKLQSIGGKNREVQCSVHPFGSVMSRYRYVIP